MSAYNQLSMASRHAVPVPSVIYRVLVLAMFMIVLGCAEAGSSTDQADASANGADSVDQAANATESDTTYSSDTDGSDKTDASDSTDKAHGSDVSTTTDSTDTGSESTDVADGTDGLGADGFGGTDSDDATDDANAPMGGVKGRVVTSDGKSVIGASALICADFCVAVELDEDGWYMADKLPPGPYKIRVVASSLGYMNMEFPQEVVDGKTTELSRSAVLTPIVEQPMQWLTDEGGTIALALGGLELTASPGELKYPLGMKEEIWGAAVLPEHLPPYQEEPWVGLEDQTYAFHINPDGTEAKNVSFKVLATSATEGTTFDAYQVDASKGTLVSIGTATADANGSINSDSDTAVTVFSTLLLVPSAASKDGEGVSDEQ